MNAETMIHIIIQNNPVNHTITVNRLSDSELKVDMVSSVDDISMTENFTYDLRSRTLERGNLTRNGSTNDWIMIKSIPIDKLETLITKELIHKAMLDV